jgi:uncharacterized protein YutE (UPF0331/DUF86 family)
MKYNGVIEKKLLAIEEQLSAIESWNITSFDLLQKNTMLQRAVERSLQVAIEAVIDTAERLLALERQTPAASSAEALDKIQELGIIAKNPQYIEMIKFRNFIVHRYEKIDLEIVYTILKKHLPLFRTFVAEVRSK